MTPEDLIPLVRFHKEETSTGTMRVTATLSISQSVTVDTRSYVADKLPLKAARRFLVEELFRQLYESQTYELYDALNEFDCCDPRNLVGIEEARKKIFKAARFQKPRLSKCCNARVKIGGKPGDGSTRWYQCSACTRGCDIKPPVSG